MKYIKLTLLQDFWNNFLKVLYGFENRNCLRCRYGKLYYSENWVTVDLKIYKFI